MKKKNPPGRNKKTANSKNTTKYITERKTENEKMPFNNYTHACCVLRKSELPKSIGNGRTSGGDEPSPLPAPNNNENHTMNGKTHSVFSFGNFHSILNVFSFVSINMYVTNGWTCFGRWCVVESSLVCRLSWYIFAGRTVRNRTAHGAHTVQ